ncbi:MAG: pseudouridine synthase, partial [Pseudomonadota bacterium]|nr:pseudouridine synthase [Pseudomonadota bacterium]
MRDIPILYEDDNLLVVNKPSGVSMHDDAKNNASSQQSNNSGDLGAGVVTLLKAQLGITQLHLCHRLDTGTSGCLCLAKTDNMAREIGELFASRQVNKYYLALSAQKPKKKHGIVIGDMKNRRGGQRILLKSTQNPAITQFFSQSASPGIRGFIVKPYSGKTHQIRVALKSIGAPILGDTLYGGQDADRLHLHAWKLVLPLSHDTVSVTAQMQSGEMFLREDVQTWFASLNKPEAFPWPNVPARYQQQSVSIRDNSEL